MPNSYFIIGTDTNCGKTYVTVKLIEYLRKQQTSVFAIKPIASGGNEDILQLQGANPQTTQPICGWLMPDPVSPHLAAKRAGISLTAAEIADFCQSYPRNAYERLLIEGAGGLMVPLNDQETWIDFLKHAALPVMVVVGMRLGCINHALLTMSALRTNNIQCAGWIANFIDPAMLLQKDNLDTLSRAIAHPLLGVVSFQGEFTPHTFVI
jgi:dethiobiotin synthetase